MIQSRGSLKLRNPSSFPKSSDSSLIDIIIDSIQDIKGKNIIRLDLSKLEESPTDSFIICEGESNTQIRAISDHIYKRVKDELKIVPNHTEGIKGSRWVLVDYFNTVVHIFYPELRSFYGLETLWNDAEMHEY